MARPGDTWTGLRFQDSARELEFALREWRDAWVFRATGCFVPIALLIVGAATGLKHASDLPLAAVVPALLLAAVLLAGAVYLGHAAHAQRWALRLWMLSAAVLTLCAYVGAVASITPCRALDDYTPPHAHQCLLVADGSPHWLHAVAVVLLPANAAVLMQVPWLAVALITAGGTTAVVLSLALHADEAAHSMDTLLFATFVGLYTLAVIGVAFGMERRRRLAFVAETVAAEQARRAKSHREAQQQCYRELLEERARRMTVETDQQAHDRVISYVCHELRNPLHGIKGSLWVLAQEEELPPVVQTELEAMSVGVATMSAIVNDILDLNKVSGCRRMHRRMHRRACADHCSSCPPPHSCARAKLASCGRPPTCGISSATPSSRSGA